MRRFLRPLAVALMIAVVVTACGGSKYEYLNDSVDGVYFKVPKDWQTADQLTASQEGRPPGDADGIDLVWSRDFWTGSAPSPSEVPAAEVAGVAQVYQGSLNEVDEISTRSLRTAIFGYDPLAQGVDPNPDRELAGLAEIANPRGWFGHRVRVNLNLPDVENPNTKVWHTRDVVYLFDGARGRVYVLQFFCESACYMRYEREIQSIMESFAVDPK